MAQCDSPTSADFAERSLRGQIARVETHCRTPSGLARTGQGTLASFCPGCLRLHSSSSQPRHEAGHLAYLGGGRSGCECACPSQILTLKPYPQRNSVRKRGLWELVRS